MNQRFDDRGRSMNDRDYNRRDDRGDFDGRSEQWQRHDMGITGNALAHGRGEMRPSGYNDRDRDRRDMGYRGSNPYADRHHEENLREWRDEVRRYDDSRGRDGGYRDDRSRMEGRGYEGSRDDRREYGRQDQDRREYGWQDFNRRDDFNRGEDFNRRQSHDREPNRGAYERRDHAEQGREQYRMQDEQRHGGGDRDRYMGERNRDGGDRRRERDIIDRDEDGNYRYSGRDYGFSWSDGSNATTWGESDNWGNEYSNHSRREGIGWNRGSTRDPRFWSTPDRDR